MKTLKTIQTLSKIGKVLSKIVFIFSVIGFCGCIAGLIGLCFENGDFIKIGGVTLHGLISENLGFDVKNVSAILSEGLIIYAGEAVLAKFAELYFKNELKAGTPFTLAGAKELLRLGILSLAISTGCAMVGSIVEGIVAGLIKAEETAAIDIHFDNSSNIALGVMFIVVSLLCRYGAELWENRESE
mgnify:FL=1